MNKKYGLKESVKRGKLKASTALNRLAKAVGNPNDLAGIHTARWLAKRLTGRNK